MNAQEDAARKQLIRELAHAVVAVGPVVAPHVVAVPPARFDAFRSFLDVEHALVTRLLATLERLLGHAEALGLEVVREGPLARGPWDALYVASTTRSLAPVAELDGEPLPTWDPVGRALASADDEAQGIAAP